MPKAVAHPAQLGLRGARHLLEPRALTLTVAHTAAFEALGLKLTEPWANWSLGAHSAHPVALPTSSANRLAAGIQCKSPRSVGQF